MSEKDKKKFRVVKEPFTRIAAKRKAAFVKAVKSVAKRHAVSKVD